MRLFAIAASVNEEGVSPLAKEIVSSYLRSHLTSSLIAKYIALFEEYLNEHHTRVTRKKGARQHKEATLNSVKVLMICQQINETLDQREKLIVFVRLIEFINEDERITDKEYDFITTVADTFNISGHEFESMMAFVRNDFEKLKDRSRLLFINKQAFTGHDEIEELGDWFVANRPKTQQEFKHIRSENLEGEILVLHIESTNTFVFRYLGEDILNLNGQVILPKQAYVLSNGGIIKSHKISPIYYSDIAGRFLHEADTTRIEFVAHGVQFRFKNSTNGLEHFHLRLESGQLAGIMGGSGVGKSTLFGVLNGSLKPQEGRILINGYNLHSDSYLLNGVIGYVPQDDLLIEELTVYQNLFYNARLCFSDLNAEQIAMRVSKILADLDLEEIGDLQVGNPLNKFISGGQRKRLNIALELIREPSVLFVDEPTSGLSSMDSETVMLLLKEQTIKGKLVVVNIHQPSSDVYKLFDKLLILDKGGRLIFNGNPIDAIHYFKHKSHHLNAVESECPTCGNVNPEQVLQIVEAKMVNEFGQFTRQRRVSPQEWYGYYKGEIEEACQPSDVKHSLPQNFFSVPNLWKQFTVFFMRNLKAKLTNTQYILINLLQAPLLAFILAYSTKYIVGSDADPLLYVFAENKNLPGFLFMSIIVALFIGLTVSAEEIIKDKRILQRESFLRLSRLSYINSKIAFLLLLSAFQSFMFVAISVWILEIQGMLPAYWFLLFTASVWANMVGLNISSGLNSVVAIYILIPFILVPQLLLSGAMIPFDDLHKRISSRVVVPVIGDMMVARWAYEALAVYNYKANDFQKHFFEYELEISDASFKTTYLLPKLRSYLDESESNKVLGKKERNEYLFLLIKNELQQLDVENPQLQKVLDYDALHAGGVDSATRKMLYARLDLLLAHYQKLSNEAKARKEKHYKNMVKELGAEAVNRLRMENHNKALNDILRNRLEIKKIVEEDYRLMPLKDPIYRKPETRIGRAHFYSPYKLVGDMKVGTYMFNMLVVWLMSAIMYLSLWHDSLRKFIDQIDGFRLRRAAKNQTDTH